MGRTSHNRAYGLMTYLPWPVPPNGGSGADSVVQNSADFPIKNPASIPSTWTGRQGDRNMYIAHSFLGLGYSVGAVTNTPELNFTNEAKVNNAQIVTGGSQANVVLTSGVDHQTGLINGAFDNLDASESHLLSAIAVNGPRGAPVGGIVDTLGPIADCAVGEQCDDVHMGLIAAPRKLVDFGGTTFLEAPGTHYMGVASGGYAILPLADIETVAAGTGADTVVRAFEVPFDCRLQSLVIQYASSGASNTLNVYNSTTGVEIHETAAVATSPTAARVVPGDFTGGLGPATRNLSKGDIIQLRVDTAASGFSNLQVLMVVNSTGHFHADHRRDWFTQDADNYPDRSSYRRYARTDLSGPVSGGWVMIPWPRGNDSTAAGTYETISSLIAPFPMEIEYAATYADAVTGTVPFQILNDTTSTNVFAAANLTTTDWHLHGPGDTWTGATVSRGDQLDLQVNTGGGESVADVMGYLIARVTGHANDHPRWD